MSVCMGYFARRQNQNKLIFRSCMLTTLNLLVMWSNERFWVLTDFEDKYRLNNKLYVT